MKLHTNTELLAAAGKPCVSTYLDPAFHISCVASLDIPMVRSHTLAAPPMPRGGLAVWVQLEGLPATDFERAKTILDAPELHTAASFRAASDRASYTLAHGLLRLMLGEFLGCPPQDFTFGRRSCHCPKEHPGKPYVHDHPVEFSLSHTRGAVAAVVSRGLCGIDIEGMPSAAHLASYLPLLPPEEVARIYRAAPHQRAAVFTEIWTLKEALVKLTGLPLMVD